MTVEEKNFIKSKIIVLIKNQKEITIDDAIEYLDYVNKVRYSYTEINPILKELLIEGKVAKKKNNFFLEIKQKAPKK